MMNSDDLRYTKMALYIGAGAVPALGIGTLISDPVATRNATKAALEAGFRLLDTAERYRTEREVGEAMQEVFKEGKIKSGDVFVVTKLWNTNHRPERVKPAFDASLKKLQNNLGRPIGRTYRLRSKYCLDAASRKASSEHPQPFKS